MSSSPAAPVSSAATSSACAADAPRLARHHARQADLRGTAREPARRRGQPAPPVRSRRHRGCGGRGAARRANRALRRALRRRDARRPLDPRGGRVHPDRRHRHVRAARGGTPGADLRASCRSRPTRSTESVAEGSSAETDELRPRNPYSASKAGADRLAYSFWATYEVPVIVTRASNNYGPQSVSRESHPALHHQPHRRPAGPALRRRPERPRLAARRGSLPRRRLC